MQTPRLSFAPVLMKDAQSAESNTKLFFRFLFFELWLFRDQIVRDQIVLVPNCPGTELSGSELS